MPKHSHDCVILLAHMVPGWSPGQMVTSEFISGLAGLFLMCSPCGGAGVNPVALRSVGIFWPTGPDLSEFCSMQHDR